MCIAVFLWRAHPVYPFLLLLNRDEYHSRPTEPLAWWDGGEILGGRDGLAGGTWLACSRDGRLAFLTNVREVQLIPQAKTRGDIPVLFLKGDNLFAKAMGSVMPSLNIVYKIKSQKSPMEFAEEVVKDADQYNGFNLILADLCAKTMVYVTNRQKEGEKLVADVLPGIHVLTNARLDSPWPKRLRDNFKELVHKYGDGEFPIKEMVEKLMTDTTKDEESPLPHIYSPSREYYLSSIFVDEETNPLGHYGTRSTSAVSVKTNGEVSFYEKYLENEQWKEQTVIYRIEERN
ncbi:hypothetical protein FEM48_Zijuj09G0152000 [Ziziphus jujuba var. spinosa]|uniref:Transport and Golgi organization 2 homolog n=1 Tax=Ziziphus jujuba var. spinosa TaxID=714518 RepID=A0A978UTQ4_ZIZJJ|nr:hypothetical protein FEM48_Zijuj09G0152000 [Ziziphus jujuba var. spinosa]